MGAGAPLAAGPLVTLSSPLCGVLGLLLAVSLPCSTVCSDRLLGLLTFRHVSCLRTIEFHSVWLFFCILFCRSVRRNARYGRYPTTTYAE